MVRIIICSAVADATKGTRLIRNPALKGRAKFIPPLRVEDCWLEGLKNKTSQVLIDVSSFALIEYSARDKKVMSDEY